MFYNRNLTTIQIKRDRKYPTIVPTTTEKYNKFLSLSDKNCKTLIIKEKVDAIIQ